MIQAVHLHGPEHEYFAALEAGKFTIQRCCACNLHVFYPRIRCPSCGSDALHWVVSRGIGTVYSATVVRRVTGGDYGIVIVELDEGVRLMSRVEGIDPTKIAIGMRVRAHVERQSQGAHLTFRAELEVAP